MHRILLAIVCLLLTACANMQRPLPADRLLRDDLFDAPAKIDTTGIFALSDAMRRYLQHDVAREVRALGPAQGLASALYRKEQLKLEYDAELTRTAAEAFEARSGNCLSLVLMSAAFAGELGLSVRYQSAYLDEAWSRDADLLVRSGHINITFEPKLLDRGTRRWTRPLTVDFLPGDVVHDLRTREISEDTVIAMYLNNRAVEILAQGRIDLAYAHARAAVGTDPAFLSAYNTLGVIYLRRGALDAAQAVFDAVLQADPNSTQALANLATLHERLGRYATAAALRERLARLETDPPLHFFNLGMAAMQRGDFSAARDLFARELARADNFHELHFWLALANYRLGDVEGTRAALTQAVQVSTTRDQQQRYSAKLAWLARQGATATKR
jgi:tetratricopeptide (TPR) repeat protein